MKLQKTSLKKSKKRSKQLVSSGPLFTVTKDNLDVRINKNIKDKWEGFLFSQLRDDWEGRRLLTWIAQADGFPSRVTEIAEEMVRSL